MNPTLSAYARQQLKDGLAKLTPANHDVFRRMYGPKNPNTPINDVVDAMPDDKLDWAMQQVERSVAKAST